jgi:hypothetical protein
MEGEVNERVQTQDKHWVVLYLEIYSFSSKILFWIGLMLS